MGSMSTPHAKSGSVESLDLGSPPAEGGGRELKELRDKHEKLEVKYNTLRNVIKKKGREKIKRPERKRAESKGSNMEEEASSSASTVRFDPTSSGKEAVVLCGWLEKLSDYKRQWNKRYFVLKSSGDLVYYYTEPRSGTKGSDARFLVNLDEVVRIVRSSGDNGFCVVSSTA
ncbi:hypothetical protein TeGR_g12576, partial [Tetraparma gracilis]